jgi:hypothetical protein
MQTQSRTASQIWKFNSLFEQNSMEDAINKACKMEYERAVWSELPILQEIYAPGWKGWQDMPGAPLVEELIEWEDGLTKDHRDDMSYPKYYNCGYMWKGELSPEHYRKIELSHFTMMANARPCETQPVLNARLAGARHLADVEAWWVFDEEAHEDMKVYSMEKHFGITEDQMFEGVAEQLAQLTKSPKVKAMNKDTVKSLNRFVALRDGPAFLMGASMLAERENPWTNQNLARALIKHYDYNQDELVFYNVHTFIDIYHARLGMYILGKYAATKEEQELVKAFYQSQKLKQMEKSKTYYARFFKGENMNAWKDDINGNIA